MSGRFIAAASGRWQTYQNSVNDASVHRQARYRERYNKQSQQLYGRLGINSSSEMFQENAGKEHVYIRRHVTEMLCGSER